MTIREYRTWPLANVDNGVTQASTLALLADIAVGLSAVGCGAWLFDQWWTRRRRLFQFGLLDLLGVILWAAIVLAAWRTGLSQPMLMPIIIPVGAAVVVYAGLIAAKRFIK